MVDAGREERLRGAMPALCSETFPDDEPEAWVVRASLHLLGASVALVEPEPKEDEDSRFVFVLRFGSDEPLPEVLAVFQWVHAQRYDLLCTGPASPPDVPPSVHWTADGS